MSASDHSDVVRRMHAEYCAASGLCLRLGIGEYSREASWFRLAKAGFTPEDVSFVVRHLQNKIRLGTRYPGCLKFSNLIERPEIFEEELSAAKAEKRNAKPAPSPKERVLNQLRPTYGNVDESHCSARHVKELIEELKRAAE